ncbi:hypothetical protein e2017b09.tmp0111 [Eimeria tenella]|uniref:Uncharacterized protein n=1 Tax=Eimeria tenella TaxID=5802 RepID=C8TDW0_EIMTE|nr:hypothetical protein e2017b09.tmp0111 [Eimeria tenella]
MRPTVNRRGPRPTSRTVEQHQRCNGAAIELQIQALMRHLNAAFLSCIGPKCSITSHQCGSEGRRRHGINRQKKYLAYSGA